jgi:hypothetical protein
MGMNQIVLGFWKPKWWARLGLNQRPIGYEPTALTTELRARGHTI